MAHKHSVYDTDLHFAIDPITRVIANQATAKTTLIQYDHNSERFTFEVPRLVDGHDMSLCNKIEVHYLNIASDKSGQNADVYLVDDMQLSPESDDIVIFSWLISHNATTYAGSLNFLVRFLCLTGDTIDYAWNTGLCQSISISTGMNNSETVFADYTDVLEAWYQKIDTVKADKDYVEEYVAGQVAENTPVKYVTSGATLYELETGAYVIRAGGYNIHEKISTAYSVGHDQFYTVTRRSDGSKHLVCHTNTGGVTDLYIYPDSTAPNGWSHKVNRIDFTKIEANSEAIAQLDEAKADKEYVDEAVANASVDLTGYASEDYVDDVASAKETHLKAYIEETLLGGAW